LRPRKLEVYGSRAAAPPGLADIRAGTAMTPALPLRGQHTLTGARRATAALCFPF